MPAGIEDRNADVWEALLAVADAAGGDWPNKARVAAVTLVTHAKAASPSLGIRLLADLRTVFGGRETVSTEEILTALHKIEEAPWADIKGKPLDPRRLALYLRPYDVQSKVVRTGDRVHKGYAREDLHDPWVRYLGEAATSEVTKVTPETTDACPRCAGEGCAWCEVSTEERAER
jgi:hypothetical protein